MTTTDTQVTGPPKIHPFSEREPFGYMDEDRLGYIDANGIARDCEYAHWMRERREGLEDTYEKRGSDTIRHMEAEQWPDDPPGAVRYVVIYPDGRRNPRNGRVRGEGRGPVARMVPGVPAPLPSAESGSSFPRGPLNGGS